MSVKRRPHNVSNHNTENEGCTYDLTPQHTTGEQGAAQSFVGAGNDACAGYQKEQRTSP